MIYAVIDRERLSPTSSTGFTAAQIPPTDGKLHVEYVRIQALNGDIWYTTDGTTVTSSVGMKLPENSVMEIHGIQAMTAFLCIDDGDGADLECKYMGQGGG